jgi:DNA-binding NarL/FixJ family response regulator
LIDIGLPDRNGADLAQDLAMLPWSPRVVLTSSDRDGVVGGDSIPVAAALPFVPKEDLTEDTLRELFKTQ